MSPTFTGAFRLMHGTALMRSRWLLEAARSSASVRLKCLRSEGLLLAGCRRPIGKPRHVGEAHARYARLLLRRRRHPPPPPH